MTRFAVIGDGDKPLYYYEGKGDGGVPVPEDLAGVPASRLFVQDGELIDGSTVSTWYVDAKGNKHLKPVPDSQALSCGWDAKLVQEGGAWRVVTDTQRLDGIKARAKRTLGILAEQARLRHITDGAGKSAVYAIKRDEARRWQSVIAASGSPKPAEYPWMAARAARLKVSLQEVADEWSAKAANWEAIGRDIEDVYEAAVEAVDALVDAATAEADIDDIFGATAWP